MVATRGTDQIVEFVVGKEKIAASSIPQEAWIGIIHEVVESLPMKWMRGFKSLNQILHYEGSYGVHRLASAQLPRLWLDNSGSIEVLLTAVFLLCAERARFPNPWSDGRQDNQRVEAKIVKSEHLLLSRAKEFFLLSATWNPIESWDDRSMSSSPEEFHYELECLKKGKLSIRKLSTEDLRAWFVSEPVDYREDRIMQEPPESDVLVKLYLAVREAADDMENQYKHIREKKAFMEGCMNRAGLSF